MSSSIAPESNSDRESVRSIHENKSLSEQLLAELSPRVNFNVEQVPRMHVKEFTSGEIVGNEPANRLPPLKGKEASFIPLNLARDYVKKMENDMKSMHNHYKEMLLELDKSYSNIESDVHKKYKEFIEKWKNQMDKKCKSLKSAYEEEHKLREELRSWAEMNVISLQEKIKELSEDKKKSLEKIDTLIASGGKESEAVRKIVEAENHAKIEKIAAEKSKIEAELKRLDGKVKSGGVEIARLVVEMIVQKAEFVVFKDVKEPEVKPGKDKGKEADRLKEEIKGLKKQLFEAQTAMAAQPKIDPSIVKEKEALKQKIHSQKESYQKEIAELTSEKESLRKELAIFSKSVSEPSGSDDPEKQTLKAQIALLAAELASSREKAANSEGQVSQIRSLQETLQEKQSELDNLQKKLSEPRPAIIKESADPALTERLHEEILQLRSKINELTNVPAAALVSKPGDDKEKKELKATLKMLQKHNEQLKIEIAGSKEMEAAHEDVKLLKLSLQEAQAKIKYFESRENLEPVREYAPAAKQSKKSKGPIPIRAEPPVRELEEELRIANERLRHYESEAKAKQPESLKHIEELEQKLMTANQEITFLKDQLNSSGKPVAVFPTEEIDRLNHEIVLANERVRELTEELGSKGPKADVEGFALEIAALKKENETLKSNDKSGQISKLQANIKTLEEELLRRPLLDEVNKLREVIKAQEKQIMDSMATQGQQMQTLNQQIIDLKLAHDTENKENELKLKKGMKESSEAINKLNQKIVDLENIREQLDKQLQFELDSKGKIIAELEYLRKVAGEVAALSKKAEELTVALAQSQEKNAAKELELKDSLRQRKLLHNQLEDLKGKIRVFCRVRPLSKTEIDRGSVNITTIQDEFTIICDSKNGVKPFVYDSVFGPNSTQEEVFEDTRRVVQSAVDGYNVCVFAYGQTGSGKTFTMTGVPGNPGVTPRAMDELFAILGHLPGHYKWEVTCYMVELYLDTLVDLFIQKDSKSQPPSLTIKKDIKGTVTIPEATILKVKNSKEIMAKFDEGNLMRHTSSTKMNDMSSRSHLVFGVLIDVTNTETNQRTVGKLSLVDLAGSERVSKTEATAERLKEGRAINKSLSALGDVISALSANEGHIPYRNNKLTMLMSDSLGGTAKTLMFVNVSPANYNQEETTMSLYYAARVKLITNDPTKNIESKEMSNMKSELMMVTGERDKYKYALEKNGINPNNLENIPESRNEDYDDAKYDDL